MTVVTTLGSSNSKQKDYYIKFPRQKEGNLVVLTTLELGSPQYHDTFTVNIANITKDGFTARVTRLDGNGWGMSLRLHCMIECASVY